MTEEEQIEHVSKNSFNLCECNFSVKKQKVADHCYLSGKFRETLCNIYNLKIQKPNRAFYIIYLIMMHAHFIVTELGNDTKSISVILNDKEKHISFLKPIINNFSIRFIDSCRFMASKLHS